MSGKYLPLTQGMYTLVDDEDFDWLNQWKWQYQAFGCADKGYAVNNKWVKGSYPNAKCSTTRMHRFIMSAPKGSPIDHINGNTLDNRKENLRICTTTDNNRNIAKKPNCTSQFKGVSFVKSSKKWLVSFRDKDGKNYNLGTYINEEVAARVWDKAAYERDGQYARLNFPSEYGLNDW